MAVRAFGHIWDGIVLRAIVTIASIAKNLVWRSLVLHPLGQDSLPLGSDLTERLDREDLPEDAHYPKLKGEFNERCMASLRLIAEAVPNLELVLSSTWRQSEQQMATVNKELEASQMRRLASSTPSLGPGPSRRAREIRAWLAENASTGEVRYCALDDQDLCADKDEVSPLRVTFRPRPQTFVIRTVGGRSSETELSQSRRENWLVRIRRCGRNPAPFG